MAKIGAFRFWCQKVLPLVYDDSITYYELLNKMVVYLNNVISDFNTVAENFDNLDDAFDTLQGSFNDTKNAMLHAYDQLQSYVNDYFDNLDVQEEINNKLDEMAEDGSLSELLEPFIESQIAADVAAWLQAHITPTSPAVDSSLTVSGAAADAKAAGDRIRDLERNNSINVLDNVTVSTQTIHGITFTVIDPQTINVAGTSTSLASKNLYSNSNGLPDWLEKGKQYYLEYSTESKNVLFRIYLYRNGSLTRPALVETTGNTVFTLPEDTTGIIISLDVKVDLTVDEDVTFAILNANSNLQLTKNIENIYPVISTTTENIEKNNSYNALSNVTVNTASGNGITFTVIDTQTIHVEGTSTALASKNIFTSATLPEWLEKGKQYFLEYHTESENVLFRIYLYRNGSLVTPAFVEVTGNTVFTLPEDTTGIMISLDVKVGLTVDEDVTFAILNANSNLQLTKDIENIYPVILNTNSADVHNETINLLNPDTITTGYVLVNNKPSANASFYYSDYIPIGMNKFCFSQVGSVTSQVCCYDADKNYLGRIDYNANTDHFEEGNIGAATNLRFRTFTPLDGTVYIRVCGGINRPKMVTPFFSPMDFGARAQNLPYGKIFRKYGKRVAMFGDSITLGTNGNGGGRVEKNLSFYLEALTGWIVDNYGVGSQGWVSTQYTDTIAYENISSVDLTPYDVITLCYGVNDTRSPIGDYDSTDETTVCGQINKCINYILTQNNKAIVILIAPFNTGGTGSFPGWRYPEVVGGWSRAQLSEKEKQIAAYYHIPFISQDDSPFFGYGIGTPDGTRTNQFVGTDNVHPTPEGYKVEGHWLTAKIKTFVY